MIFQNMDQIFNTILVILNGTVSRKIYLLEFNENCQKYDVFTYSISTWSTDWLVHDVECTVIEKQ